MSFAALIGLLVAAGPSRARAQVAPAKDEAANALPSAAAAADTSPALPVKPADEPAPVTKPAVDRSSVFRLLLHANPMLWPLAICSIVTLGYVMERFAALRRERVIPHEFVERFLERLSSGKLDRERRSRIVPGS